MLYKEIVDRDNALSFNPAMFQQQRDFIDDPSKLKSLLTSRRSGKSTLSCIYLVQEARSNPSSQSLYVGLTRKSAKTFVWRELKRLNSEHKLGITFNNTDLVAELPNASQIFLVGGNDSEAIEAIRGTIKPRLIIIDEAASYRSHLQYLIDEVLTPMLIDYNGTLCLIGTPSASCAGPFFDATTGVEKAYSCHKWTLRDNPFVPHAVTWLDEYCKAKGWDDQNPIYLREWCGRWIRSSESMVYKYNSEVNDLVELPKPGKYSYLIGVDIGYNDATAFTIGAYRENDPTFYVVETFKKSNMTVDDIMSKLNTFISTYDPDKVVMDSGGGGKLVAASFRRRYSIPIMPAQKTDKKDFIEQMNSEFLSGRIKVLPGNESLSDEWKLVQWDEDFKKEDPKYINDLCDSALYVWRESYHYTETLPPPDIVPGTELWAELQVRQMEKQAEAEYLEQLNSQAEEAMLYGSRDSS